MLGYSGFMFQLMRFDGTSGDLEMNVSFNYGNDLAFLPNGNLLVGSWTQPPNVYTTDLGSIGTFNAVQRLFVATMPEPTILFQDGMEGL
jgi:hypothetical protein